MSITFDATSCQKCLSLWNGTTNNVLPIGVADPSFDDSAWITPITTVPQPPSTGVWPSNPPVAHTEQALFRHHFTVPADVVSASIAIMGDDVIDLVWLNGVQTNVGGNIDSGAVIQSLPEVYFRTDAPNVLTILGRNADPTGPGGGACVAYSVTITTTADTEGNPGTSAGTLVANSGSYGIKLGESAYGRGALLARHSSGVVCWEHDGTLFRVRSGDLTVMQTPFPVMSDAPLALLGKDPHTGLPMWTAGLTATTGALPLPADPPPPVVDVPSPSNVLHVVPKRQPVPIPTPVADYCPVARCGAAYYLSQKLSEQYDLIRNLLLAMLATPIFFGIGPTDVLLNALDILIDWLAARVAIKAWVVHVIQQIANLVSKGARFIATDFEALGGGGSTTLQRLAYASLSCNNGEFYLTPDMLVGWELAINSDTIDFSEWQRHTLVYCIQFTPFSTYHQLAQHGAAIGSNDCGGW